jgi:RNA polymerase sigma-70 factor (sigma-E family)
MTTVPVFGWSPALADGAPAAELNAALTELYGAHYQSLVRLAAMLLRDAGAAEEIVQDAFVSLYRGWARLRDPGVARFYLQKSVVNRSRSVLRHRAVAEKHAPVLASREGRADQATLDFADRSAVVAALRRLPARQREAIVLRYYADLSEADIARAMGITAGAVKSHTARAVSALREILNDASVRG